MDLITDLPPASGHDSIVVFVDLFTKLAHFAPTTKTCTAQELARLFLANVYRHHSLPEVIVSDRDPRITSVFFRTLFRRLGTNFNMSTAYHPQTDGQTERTNRTLQQILRSFVHPLHDDWPDLLPVAEAAYNTSLSASTGTTPFAATYGFEPRTPATIQVPPAPSPQPTADSYLARLKDTHALLRANLEKAKAEQAAGVNAHRRDATFEVGDQVRLDTEHLQLADQPCPKFRDRFVGPFTVAEVISPVVYRLHLPAAMRRVHPTFHITRLQRWTANPATEFPGRVVPDRPLPAAGDYVGNAYEVASISAAKIGPDPQYRGQALLFRVHWAAPYESPEHDSWEPLRNVSRLDALALFLGTPAWAAFKASPGYAAFRRRYPRKLPCTPAWLAG
jgi:hypothetical protein